MADKELTAIQKRMQAMTKSMTFKSSDEIQAFERHMETMTKVSKTVDGVQKEITLASKPEQMLFSFMPTDAARTSPFFPISKREMKDRAHEVLTWETAWGRISIRGEKLSVFDETVLLALLALVAKTRSEVIDTSISELCRIIGTAKGKTTFKAITSAIDRLLATTIKLERGSGKGSKKKYEPLMGSTILTNYLVKKSGGFQIMLNPYFIKMYSDSFITGIDLKFRNQLKGDTTKAVYRFYNSQKGKEYSCHVLTLARAINLNMDLPARKLRDRIRRAHAELKKQGYLTRAMISRHDVIRIRKK